MNNNEQVLNPIVRYEIFDKKKDDYIKEQPSTIEGIIKVVYGKEQVKSKLEKFSKCMTFQIIDAIAQEKDLIITPVKQISTSISGSNKDSYNFTSLEVTLNNKKKTNIIDVCPIEIDGQLITQISFSHDNHIIYKYFNNMGEELKYLYLVSKEIYNEPTCKNSIIKQYDCCDNLMCVIVDGVKYSITCSIMRGYAGNRKFEILKGNKSVDVFFTNNKNEDIDSLVYDKIIKYHFK